MGNHLHYGDNLEVLRNSIPDESVDLIYLDPPFNSNASYNVLFKGPSGNESAAQIEAFDDTWEWGDEAEAAYGEVLRGGNTDVAEMLRAMRVFLGENDMMAYLTMMAVRLIELHRVLKATGSLYLHCDPTASHYLKILLDAVFGAPRFMSEIIWKRSVTKGDARRKFSDDHDVILAYTKTDGYYFSPVFTAGDAEYEDRFNLNDDDGRGPYQSAPLDSPNPRPNLMYEYKGYPHPPKGWRVSQDEMKKLDANGRILFPKKSSGRLRRKLFLKDQKGPKVGNVWNDIKHLQAHAQERLGYPTQKPVTLLERIIMASSNEGDTILDPFCGCGTTVHAAQKLNRNWIGIDVTHLAIGLIERRLRDAFEGIKFETHGTPKDIGGAKALAEADKYEFEKWALSLLNAQPWKGGKKGADKGIDGIRYIGKSDRCIVSVKGGKNVGVAMVRDLVGVLDREGAQMGVFLTLTPPTGPMKTEAAAAGHYAPDGVAPVPRVQIVTVEDLLEHGERALRVPLAVNTYKKAAKEQDNTAQGKLDI